MLHEEKGGYAKLKGVSVPARQGLNYFPDLLKLATMMGIGRVIQRTPQMAQREPTSFPPAVVGAMSPYPAKHYENHIYI